MSFNGSGTYSLPAGNPVVTGTNISSTWANQTLSDIASALSQVLIRDGQAAMTGTLNMGTQNISNATNITASGTVSTGNLVLTSSTIPANGWYLPSTNTAALATNTTARITVNATGNVTIAAPSSGVAVAITGVTGGNVATYTDGTVIAGLLLNGSSGASTGTTSAHAFGLATNGTVRWTLSSTGAVSHIVSLSGALDSMLQNSNSGATAKVRYFLQNDAGRSYGLVYTSSANTTAILNGGPTSESAALYTSSNFPLSIGANATEIIRVTGSGATVLESLNSINAQKSIATYETGSFTATLTGCTTSPTGTVKWTRIGNVVTLLIPFIQGTSNSNNATLTGMPANLIPTTTSQQTSVLVTDNGSQQAGSYSVLNTGVISMGLNNGSVFTTSGTKATGSNFTAVYQLT